MANLGVPAWTALQADLIPRSIRGGQYYANRSVVLNVCALAATFAANFLLRLDFPKTTSLFSAQPRRWVLPQLTSFLAFPLLRISKSLSATGQALTDNESGVLSKMWVITKILPPMPSAPWCGILAFI